MQDFRLTPLRSITQEVSAPPVAPPPLRSGAWREISSGSSLSPRCRGCVYLPTYRLSVEAPASQTHAPRSAGSTTIPPTQRRSEAVWRGRGCWNPFSLVVSQNAAPKVLGGSRGTHLQCPPSCLFSCVVFSAAQKRPAKMRYNDGNAADRSKRNPHRKRRITSVSYRQWSWMRLPRLKKKAHNPR